MKSQPLAWTLLLVALASGRSLLAAPPATALTVPVKIVNVVDGDTVDVECTVRVRVRLCDCWCPETNTTKGKAAADSLRVALLAGKDGIPNGTLSVPLQSNKLSDILTLNRVLGYVWVEGSKKSLSEQQVALGLASTTKGGELGH